MSRHRNAQCMFYEHAALMISLDFEPPWIGFDGGASSPCQANGQTEALVPCTWQQLADPRPKCPRQQQKQRSASKGGVMTPLCRGGRLAYGRAVPWCAVVSHMHAGWECGTAHALGHAIAYLIRRRLVKLPARALTCGRRTPVPPHTWFQSSASSTTRRGAANARQPWPHL